MKTTNQLFAAALVFAALATPAAAAPYVALDIGQTKAKDACTTAAGCQDTAGALRVALGSEFSPQFSGEVSYGAYGKASRGPGNGDWKLSGFQLAGIGALPLNDVFSFTGKVGLAATKLDITATGKSATSTNLMFGVGALIRLNTDASVRVQYESLGTVGDNNTTGTAKVSLLSAGIVYRF